MAPRQLPGDVEPEPGAGNRAERGVVEPDEALEHVVMLVGRDPDPVVAHRQQRRLLIGDRDRDRGSARAVGQGVVDQVVEDPADMVGVGLDQDRFRGRVDDDLGLEQQGSGLGTLQRRAGGVAEVENERPLG